MPFYFPPHHILQPKFDRHRSSVLTLHWISFLIIIRRLSSLAMLVVSPLLAASLLPAVLQGPIVVPLVTPWMASLLLEEA